MENNPKQTYNNPQPSYNPSPNYPMNLNFDSHDSFKTVDSHDYTDIDQTTVEQFNFENYYPNAMAPVQNPVPYPAQAPTAHAPETLYPIQQCQTNALENVIIPHVHPSHTTHNMHTHYVNQHYFPHTESCCYSTSCEDVICGPMPPCPMPMAGPGVYPHPAW